MLLFLNHDDGSLMRVDVYEGNIINLAKGIVERSEQVAIIRLDNGMVHDPDVFCVEVNPSMTIKNLKDRIERRRQIPPGLQTLIHNGEELEMGKTLEHYKMCDAPLHINLSVRELWPTSDSPSNSNSS